MPDIVHIPKTLAKRLERVATLSRCKPDAIVKSAIEERLEWSKRSSKQLLEVEIYIEADTRLRHWPWLTISLLRRSGLSAFPSAASLGAAKACVNWF